jgi:hypothetical protein
MQQGSDVKYCVTAMIDLLGFSSHLEIGSYDLRTTIGKQAVNRLENLEKAIALSNGERKKYRKYYPQIYSTRRINCAFRSS